MLFQRHDGGVGPEDDVAYYGFLNILDDVLLPCLSLLQYNCCIAEELWEFMKYFPYELRYKHAFCGLLIVLYYVMKARKNGRIEIYIYIYIKKRVLLLFYNQKLLSLVCCLLTAK